MLFYKFLYWLVYQFFKKRVEKEGLGNLPKTEGFIIAPNHEASYDPLIIAAALKEFVYQHFLPFGKKIYFLGSTQLKSRFLEYSVISFLINLFQEKIGYLPANRFGLKRALTLLAQNNIVVIFPEGKRNTRKILERGRKGVAVLALLSGKKVVPTGCFGPPTQNLWQKVVNLFSRRRVKFGFPIQFPQLNQEKLDHHPFLLKMTLDIIMEKIAKISEKNYLIMSCRNVP